MKWTPMDVADADRLITHLSYQLCKKKYKLKGDEREKWLGLTNTGLHALWMRPALGGEAFDIGRKRDADLRIHDTDHVDVKLVVDLDDEPAQREVIALMPGWSVKRMGNKFCLVNMEYGHSYTVQNDDDLLHVPCNAQDLSAEGVIPYYDWARQNWFDLPPSIFARRRRGKASRRRNPILDPRLGDVITLEGGDYIYVALPERKLYVSYLGDNPTADLIFTDPTRPPLEWDLTNDTVRMTVNAGDWKRRDRYFRELTKRRSRWVA